MIVMIHNQPYNLRGNVIHPSEANGICPAELVANTIRNSSDSKRVAQQ